MKQFTDTTQTIDNVMESRRGGLVTQVQLGSDRGAPLTKEEGWCGFPGAKEQKAEATTS